MRWGSTDGIKEERTEENDMTCCLIQRNRTFWMPSLDSPQSQVCIYDPHVPPPHNICHTQFTSSACLYLLQLGSHPFPLGNTGASTESGPEKALKFFVEWMKLTLQTNSKQISLGTNALERNSWTTYTHIFSHGNFIGNWEMPLKVP